MSLPAAWPQVLDFFGTPLVIEPSPGQLASDAGLLPICQFDQHIGLTWRTLLIKVAAEVIVRTRRVVTRLSSSGPHLDWYRRVCERLHAPLPTPVPHPSG
jgi:hypothetical protein